MVMPIDMRRRRAVETFKLLKLDLENIFKLLSQCGIIDQEVVLVPSQKSYNTAMVIAK